MISGDVLKYRKGLLIPKRYETRLTASSPFPLTAPFQFTQKGKLVPPELSDAIAHVQANYDPSQHLALGESPNLKLMEDLALLAYLADRFAIVGTPDDCVEQIQRVRAGRIDRILFTGNIADRSALIRNLGTSVLPRCRD